MFLNSMRHGIFSGVFLGILVLGAVGLMLSDWGNFFRDGVSRTDVAKINGKPIGAQEFDRIVRRSLNTQNIQPDVAYKAGMIDQILQQEIMVRLLHNATNDVGIVVSDAIAAEQIHKLLEPIAGPNGDKKEAWNRILQSQGLREKDMVNGLKNDIATGLLRQTIAGEIYVPQSLTTAFYGWNLEERNISYVNIPQSSVKVGTPTDDELAKFYSTIESQYAIPESRDISIAVLDPNDLIKKAEITDADIQKYYDEHQDDFSISETRDLEQAVLNTEAEAKKVYDEAATSKDLKKAVTKVTGSNDAFSKEASFEQKGLTNDLATPVFSAKSGDIVGPLKSPLGWHVIAVKEVHEPGVQPFAKVKAQIKTELTHSSGSDELFELTNQIEDRLADGEKLETLAAEFKMKLINISKATTGSTPFQLKDYAVDQSKILQAAFSTNENESSPISEISNGRMFTVHVNKIEPSKSKDLKDIKAEITKLWTTQEIRKQLLIQSLELTKQLDDKKTTLDQIAKKFNTSVKSGKVVRGSNPPAGIAKDSVPQIMGASTSKAIAIPGTDGVLLANINSISMPQKKPSASELKDVEKNLMLDVQEERFGALMSYLQAKNSVHINAGLIDRLYGQPQADQ